MTRGSVGILRARRERRQWPAILDDEAFLGRVGPLRVRL